MRSVWEKRKFFLSLVDYQPGQVELQAVESRCANLLPLQVMRFQLLHIFRTLASEAHGLQNHSSALNALLNVTIHNIVLRLHHATPSCSICPENGRFGTTPSYLATARNTLTKWRRPTELIIITQLQSAGCSTVLYDLCF